MDTFSKWLVEERESRDWSQNKLAGKMKLSQAAVSRVEAGLVPPTTKFCEGVAEVFDIPLETVLRKANILPPSSDNNDPWVIATQRQLAQLTPESRDIADTLIKALRDREKGQHKK